MITYIFKHLAWPDPILQPFSTILYQSLKYDNWTIINEDYSYQSVTLCHYGIEQRWLVVNSKGAFERANKTVEKKVKKEQEKIEKQLKKLERERFKTKKELLQNWKILPSTGSTIMLIR